MTDQLPHVSVIVPARNAERLLAECLASVTRNDYPPDRREIVVVDNRSTDRTAEIAARYPVRCITETTPGPSAARNRGIEASGGEILAFMDADCVATTGWLRELVRGFDGPSVAGVAGEIHPYPPRTPAERYMATRKSHWQTSGLSRGQSFVATGNAAFRKETFDRVGGFDSRLPAGEDKDFSWRLFSNGLKVNYNARAVVLHRHRTSAWGVFEQHMNWGRGNVFLHRKYGFPWSVRQELGKYLELSRALGALTSEATRYGTRRGDWSRLEQRYFEVLRRAGFRMGALRGLAASARRRHQFHA